jgi:hypothetical protein
MNFKELNPPIVEFPEHQIWHRIQRLKARKDSIRINGFVLAPTGGLTGHFDLADEVCAYLADSELTALYESLFRLESRSCHWDRLEERAIASFQNVKRLRLVDCVGWKNNFPYFNPYGTNRLSHLRRSVVASIQMEFSMRPPNILTIDVFACLRLGCAKPNALW